MGSLSGYLEVTAPDHSDSPVRPTPGHLIVGQQDQENQTLQCRAHPCTTKEVPEGEQGHQVLRPQAEPWSGGLEQALPAT